MITLSLVLLLLPVQGFVSPAVATDSTSKSTRFPFRFPFFSTPRVVEAVAEENNNGALLSTTESPFLSWSELEEMLPSADEKPKPVLTLYRDTNGWCPFCERIWAVLRAKQVPFTETLVNLQDKPQWYKDMVPTTLVPAVLLYGSDETNERKLVWESMDIMKLLDEEFPDSPKMLHETDEFSEAMEMNDALSRAGFAYIYSSRNTSLTEEDVEDRRVEFLKQLDLLDAALGEKEPAGPFILGDELTGIDVMMIPVIERWRYQLPITIGIDILEGRSNLKKWVDAMESHPALRDRVLGDEYSWTAVASTFLRIFGGNSTQSAEGIGRADEAAASLMGSFEDNSKAHDKIEYSIEAGSKLVSNHEAVVKDCTNAAPKSQKELPRASSVETADVILRYVASILLSGKESVLEEAEKAGLPDLDSSEEAALVCKTVAARVCAPRDMSAPAAMLFRGVLSVVARRLGETA